MNWNLKCRRVRKLLALEAGNDLAPAERTEAERHLAVCPCCRELRVGLNAGQQVLERVRTAPVERESVPSVWPAVYRHVRTQAVQPAAPQWHGWLPVGALAAACLLIVVVTSQGPGPIGSEVSSQGAPVIVQPVDVFTGPQREFRDRPDPRFDDRRPAGPPVRMLLDGTTLLDL